MRSGLLSRVQTVSVSESRSRVLSFHKKLQELCKGNRSVLPVVVGNLVNDNRVAESDSGSLGILGKEYESFIQNVTTRSDEISF